LCKFLALFILAVYLSGFCVLLVAAAVAWTAAAVAVALVALDAVSVKLVD
jgi:hypothetical protein